VLVCAPEDPFAATFPDSHGVLHLVEDGEIEFALDDEPPDFVGAGDVMLISRGHRHTLRTRGSAVPVRPMSSADLRSGDSERPVRWLCGSFVREGDLGEDLLAKRPSVIVFRGSEHLAADWLAVSSIQLAAEMSAPSQGSSVMISRILDLVLVQVLRSWAAHDETARGWLAGAMDPEIGSALAALHGDLRRPWTVAQLAAEAALSRSVFAERFTTLIGEPPAAYLAGLRLEAAAEKLRGGRQLVQVGARVVGYTSEPAFSRAFKNRFGTSPARWRTTADRDGSSRRR